MSNNKILRKRLHLWQGYWIDDGVLRKNLEEFPLRMSSLLQKKLDLSIVLESCHIFSQKLNPDHQLYGELTRILKETSALTDSEIAETLMGLREFLKKDQLKKKIQREFQLPTMHDDPFEKEKLHDDGPFAIFEGWAPLGVLTHVAPANAYSVGILSMVEGLLTGNINFLKTSRIDSIFSAKVLEEIGKCDPHKILSEFIFVLNISSGEKDLLRIVYSFSEAVAVWGGEEAVKATVDLAPRGVRIIEWGPKISFAYISRKKALHSDLGDLQKVAEDIVHFEQQACSAPQCFYVESENAEELFQFGQKFAEILGRVSSKKTPPILSSMEDAEITAVTELCKLEEVLGTTHVIEDPSESKSWRVLIELDSSLKTSPLNRTLWIKPLLPKDMISVLRPFRPYLQTVGLSAFDEEFPPLADLLIRAGALRITPVGEMQESYIGEPHDGTYALTRYCKRVSVKLKAAFKDVRRLSVFEEGQEQGPVARADKTMTKEDFQNMPVPEGYPDLFFKSGGTGGEPKLSVFSYDDYLFQMNMAADGLLAAGLDPHEDKVMNLFFAGGLYGGFLSFFSILENLRVKQFPMAAHMDFKMVGETIVKHGVTTVLGMPSYLMQLFHENKILFSQHKVIRKIFFGGEPFTEKQKEFFQENFAISLIRSATYGSVDAGPLGYQCLHSKNGVHHLLHKLQHLEILKMDQDCPVEEDEVGRLVFTSLQRNGPNLNRYEIGDLGRWAPGVCPCGRNAARFELLGRFGDIFKAGGSFINYQKIQSILSDSFNYSGEMQLTLDSLERTDRLNVAINQISGVTSQEVAKTLLGRYADLKEIIKEKTLRLEISFKDVPEFERIAGSGKLKRVIDLRWNH